MVSAASACWAPVWRPLGGTAIAEAASNECGGQRTVSHGPRPSPIALRVPGWLTALPLRARGQHGSTALQSNADGRAGLSRCRPGWWQGGGRQHLRWQPQRATPSAAIASVPASQSVDEGDSSTEDDSEGDAPSIEPEVEEPGAGVQEEALRLLEWPALCKQVAEFASTPIAVAMAQAGQLRIGRTQAESVQLLAETEAARHCTLTFEGVRDIRKVVQKAAAGQCCQIAELADVGASLEAADRLQRGLVAASTAAAKAAPGALDPLLTILEPVTVDLQLAQDIRRCLSAEPPLILDTASAALASIRSQRRDNMRALQQLLGTLAAQLEASGAAEQGMVVARRGRLCVAVKAARRGDIRGGITLDQSNTGVTVYVEPEEAIALNNREMELSGQEAEEETRILKQLSSQVAHRAAGLLLLLERITALDLAVARAAHAAWLHGTRPTFSAAPPSVDTEASSSGRGDETSTWLDIQQMRHPLLLAAAIGPLNKKQDPRTEHGSAERLPVPIDIRVDPHVRVVAITGPNTGGKTATLKTLGMAALMVRAGLFVPAQGAPVVPWFDAVLADVGDEQSLQQSLSTFSGHVRRLTRILQACGPSSLVLLDEAGGGTDPSEGAALATALLKHLAGTAALTVATTHYSELKALKEQDSRFENASVEFDRATLRPTYKVLWGVPGQSNALDIASALDFDADVLREARLLLRQLAPAGAGERASSLLGPLMQQADGFRDKAAAAEGVLAEARHVHASIAEEAAGLAKRERRLQKAKEEEVAQLIAEARREMRAVVEQLQRQANAGGSAAGGGDVDPYEAGTRLQDIAAAYSPDRQQLEDYVAATAGARVDRARGATWQPEPGDLVLVRRLGTKPVQVAEATDRQGSLVVVLGQLRLRVKRDEVLPLARDDDAGGGPAQPQKRPSSLSQLQRAFEGEAGTSEGAISGVSGVDVLTGPAEAGPAMQTAGNTVDLRGMRVDEATRALETALMHSSGGDQMYIIHGVGTGAIRQAVEKMLKKHPYVESFALESEANQGLTIAQLK
ncbi:putative MutS homolog 2 [Klebsormidium nitens]|uniref:Putative MutS homolog 2 n=1 Tax=Klebsormidium nitens TaxID=105231 RepID=A0A1Y1I131_KLENI|nr:putative MutS homolog 2 [Klebsormidium nitens]|eukprot:GAQ84173.1 putative MutS homolog 2 [Klebsormidium nitens]